MSKLRNKFRTVIADDQKQEEQGLNPQEPVETQQEPVQEEPKEEEPKEEEKDEKPKQEENEELTPQIAYAVLNVKHFIENENLIPNKNDVLDILKDTYVELVENDGDYRNALNDLIGRRVLKIHQEEGWEVSFDDFMKDFLSDFEWFKTNITPEQAVFQVNEIINH